MKKKRKKSRTDKVVDMLSEIVDDLYRHSIISKMLAETYVKRIGKI